MDRIVALFIHPVKFTQSRSFEFTPWLPIILLTVILASLHYTMLPELLETYNSPEYLTQFAERGQMTEVAAQAEIAKMRDLAPYMGLVEAPIVILAGIAGVASVLYIIGRIQFRKKVPFVSLYAMVAWGSLVSGAPLLVNLIVRIIRPGTLLSTNAAAFLPKTMEGTYFYNIMLAVDPFLMWQVWLMGLGVATLCEVNRQRAISSVGTMFVVLSIINAWTMTLAGKLNG